MHARGVLAVHALQRHGLVVHERQGARLALLVADVIHLGILAVLALARGAAGEAADAVGGIDKHSVAGHYAPTFFTVTSVSCDMVPP